MNARTYSHGIASQTSGLRRLVLTDMADSLGSDLGFFMQSSTTEWIDDSSDNCEIVGPFVQGAESPKVQGDCISGIRFSAHGQYAQSCSYLLRLDS